MSEIIEEELGFNKKIAKFDKFIDKLESKNNKHKPRNDKQKEYKKELKECIKILRSNSKELKKINNYNFKDEDQKQQIKKVTKRLINSQINFISGVNNSGFIGFLKELGLGTLMGAIVAGFSYLLNNHSYNEDNTLLLGRGAKIYSQSKNLYNELDIKKIMTYDAAEKGLWASLIGTSAMVGKNYNNASSLRQFKFNPPDDKKTIKENYFPY